MTRYQNQKKKEEEQPVAAAEPEEESESEDEDDSDEEEEGAVGGEEEEELDLGVDLGVLDGIEYESDYDDDVVNFIHEDDEDDQVMDVETAECAPAIKKFKK